MRQNGEVFMSVEVLAVIIAAASLFVGLGGGLFAGFAWMLRRMDERFAQAETSINERFNNVDEKFDKVDEKFDKVDKKFDRVDEKFDKVYAMFDRVHDELHDLRTELTEVKISVARLEGPSPRLIWPRS